jgi:hypothetical protein
MGTGYGVYEFYNEIDGGWYHLIWEVYGECGAHLCTELQTLPDYQTDDYEN